MKFICPTVTADNVTDYNHQLMQASQLSKRIHIDLADTTIAPRQLVVLSDISWPSDLVIDLHVMLKPSEQFISQLTNLKPHLVIFHFYEGLSIAKLVDCLTAVGIKVGVAIPANIEVHNLAANINTLSHILIFSGNLGYQGGSTANLSLLSKVNEIRGLNQQIEVGWDGGVNDKNIAAISHSGVNVINVGGYLSSSDNPKLEYDKLLELI